MLAYRVNKPITQEERNAVEQYRLGEISYKQLRQDTELTDPLILNIMKENGHVALLKIHPDDILADTDAFMRYLEFLDRNVPCMTESAEF